MQRRISNTLDECQSDRQRDTIRGRVEDYMNRAESLKKHLKSGNKKPVAENNDKVHF